MTKFVGPITINSPSTMITSESVNEHHNQNSSKYLFYYLIILTFAK